jgi:hypothetical protein
MDGLMQLLAERLLDMALKLETGGVISGEDAARTIREAMAWNSGDEISGLRGEIARLNGKLAAFRRNPKRAA